MKPASFPFWATLSLILSGFLQLVIGPMQQIDPVAPPSPEYDIRHGLIIGTHVLVLIGIVALARSGATGKSVLGRIGLGLALVAGTAFIPSEAVIPFNFQLGDALDGICGPLLGSGMTLAGVAVLRAQQWQGWGRVVPLLFGFYPFVVIMPFIVATGEPNFVAIGGWGLFALLLGIALRVEAVESVRTRQETKVVAGQ
jgi:hypothetical protein